MPPRQLSNSLLDNYGIGPSLGKGAHVHQVGSGKDIFSMVRVAAPFLCGQIKKSSHRHY
jgi:hypothetical protein